MEKGRAGIPSKFLMASPPFFYKETSGSPILRLESSHSCCDEDDDYECSEASIPQPPPLTGQLIHWLGNYLLIYNFKTVLLRGTSYTTQRKKKKTYLSAQFLRTCRERWVMLVIPVLFFWQKILPFLPILQYRKQIHKFHSCETTSEVFNLYCLLLSRKHNFILDKR